MSYESTNTNTTDEYDSSTDHSFTSTSMDISSTVDVESCTSIKNKKEKKYWCFWISCINVVILCIAVCILIISGIIRLGVMNKDKESLIVKNDEIVKGEKFQMIYHSNTDDDVINEIVEMDLDFEGDFYSFEDEDGSGIIVKLDKEGEEYKMCADQCICSIECQYDNECGFGMECNEYKCIESSKNRKETISEERRIAQTIAIPLFVCVYGFFSSLILAQNYAKNTLEADCEGKCPSNSQGASTSEVKTETTKNSHIICHGRCMVNKMETVKKLPFFDTVFDFCHSSTHQNVYIEEMSINRAIEIFAKELSVFCKSRDISDDEWYLNDHPCSIDEYSVACKRSHDSFVF